MGRAWMEGDAVTRDEEQSPEVRARAILIDPVSMAVLWSNEPRAEDANREADAGPAGALDRVMPMAATLGVPEACAAAASSGEAQHLHADLVSTGRGSVAMVVSVYPLPDGTVLVLAENTWLAERREPGEAGSRHSRRRGR